VETPILDTAVDQVISREGSQPTGEAPLPRGFYQDFRGTHVSVFSGGSASEPESDPEALALYRQGLACMRDEEDLDRHRKAAEAFGAAYRRQPLFLKALLNYAVALINEGSDLGTAELVLRRGLALVDAPEVRESLPEGFRRSFRRMVHATLGSLYLELARAEQSTAPRDAFTRLSDVEHREAVERMDEALPGLLIYAAAAALAVGDHDRGSALYQRARSADPEGGIVRPILSKFPELETFEEHTR
jgi:hypothetical protein